MQVKEELTMIQSGNRLIPYYLHVFKSLANEITLSDHQISNEDLTLYILNGLGPKFQEIVSLIWAREKSLAFEEFHNLLVGHKSYLKRMKLPAVFCSCKLHN